MILHTLKSDFHINIQESDVEAAREMRLVYRHSSEVLNSFPLKECSLHL